MNRTILALFLCLIITACQSPEQTESDKFTLLSKLVDQYASHTLEKGNIHSLAVAVYLDGQVYQNYYGSIDQGQNNPPDDQSLFEIASISKVFVGSLAAKAVLEKKISLEDDIRLYLDGKYENLQFGDRPITIKHLLTHTLGFDTPEKIAAIYQEIFNGSDSGKSIDYDMDDLLEELRSVEVAREPGTAYDYSNVGPEILAYILQSVYQKSYEELLMAFFAERGMNHSFLGNKDMPGLVNGYDENGQRANLDQNPLLGGAGGIFMSLPDLATFMQFQLESQDPLIEESTRLLFQDGEDDTGYFWDLGVGEEEGFYYKKTGSSIGTQSVILICPDTKYGLIILMNNQSEAAINEWATLYGKIEYDLIKYPTINAWSTIENDFFEAPETVTERYHKLKNDDQYFASSDYLNRIGYEFIWSEELPKAIAVFELAVSVDVENANLYDSLGEAYFIAKQYDKAKRNYEQSLQLNPANENAQSYLAEIEKILNES